MEHVETERKFLIYMPDTGYLSACNGVCIKNIEQIYLVSDGGVTARVRKICEEGKISFIKTVKKRISTLSAYENEYEITPEEYERDLENADKSKHTIKKTRYCIPEGKHLIEIDVYPFWTDRAIMEIELSHEDEEFSVPEYIRVIKEVSGDKRYKNTNLAVNIPNEEIC